ncbi:hypothetical protein JOF53_001291 [Crossiella equi]|uniref:Orc1-like AAA ATPase domain-containing protein n=1 Tax=Crossiella equi TaxID=130796 RepID=A0ABS5A864_9PSEU|nr:AAA family ATPase [Crossiella equi]MBP2472419.1 hypothetical protein [Crossiella equi]
MGKVSLLGRAEELSALRAALADGGFAAVTGEAGIGKTSLVSTFARDCGAVVLTGACWGSAGVPPRWPWTQVARGLRQVLPVTSVPPALGALLGDGEAEEFALADAVTESLCALARRSPVLLVLEDLHWADPASLALLEFVVQHARRPGLLVVATYRDGEVSGPRLPALSAKAVRLPLSGLDLAATASLVTRATGVTPGAPEVERLHRRTGGNPFLVEQTARLWQGGGALDAVDPGSHALLRSRLDRLPAPVLDVLGTVAVLGPAADLGLVAALHPGATGPLGVAAVARVVVVDGDSVSFQHELLRETVLSGLPDAAGRHARVLRSGALVTPAVLAHHAWLAAELLPPEEVVGHLLAAAEHAVASFAPADAARHFAHALTLLTEPVRRARVALRLGEAADHAGEADTAARAFGEAMATARELAEPELAAHTALTLSWLRRPALPGHEEFLTWARSLLGPSPSARAVDLARSRGAELGHALATHVSVLWSVHTVPRRLALTAELVEIDRGVEALSLRAGALLEAGDPAHRELHRELLARTDLPAHRHEAEVTGTLLAVLAGEFARARACADRARDTGSQPYFPAGDLWAVQRLWIDLRAGDLDGVRALLATADGEYVPLYRGLLAVREGRAAEVPPRPSRWFEALWLRLRAETGDEGVLAELAPLSGQWLMTATVCLEGPVDHWLALLHAARGEHARAAAYRQAAEESAARLGARPWLAESPARPVFRERDGLWTLSFDRHTVHLPHTKGLRDLHTLLGAPGQDVPAVRLLSPELGAHGADPVLDDAARAAYRARLERLASPRTPAEEAERAALLAELRAATGLGGRSRRLGDEAERARKAVTNRIRDTLRRLEERHPVLARHLRDSVTTGTSCQYRPARPVDWRL